ncbi:LytR C-terminal domain-containing protein [Saccharopolyspora sp. HNM0983]|uniref:LytR C-terminal domain-containing protein n=1 Tax=Saccharopolyspora montiporae TaxID=2781240 RepID=A0A929B928_9PSEU|nr:LytR C-terminal domain-containing protein [Saccharopolyspora sp. HNM0983]MBE9374080.1 LytR C-terminal domain-containing protein [Saccharopolyspora sp. HNM0983]
MAAEERPAGPDKAKVAGYGLIGVGVIAAAIGVSTLYAEQEPEAAQKVPPAPTSGQEPGGQEPGGQEPGGQESGGQESGGDPQQGEVPADPGQAEPPAQQVPPQSKPDGALPDRPAQQVDPQQDRPSGTEQDRVVVRVYNNSKIKGLAHRAAEDFRAAGYEVPEVGNFARGVIPTTTVYFRPGTEEEAAAEKVAQRFGARAEPRFEGVGDASPGLVAIITNDYRNAGS